MLVDIISVFRVQIASIILDFVLEIWTIHNQGFFYGDFPMVYEMIERCGDLKETGSPFFRNLTSKFWWFCHESIRFVSVSQSYDSNRARQGGFRASRTVQMW